MGAMAYSALSELYSADASVCGEQQIGTSKKCNRGAEGRWSWFGAYVPRLECAARDRRGEFRRVARGHISLMSKPRLVKESNSYS
jgi:hypothetical protein